MGPTFSVTSMRTSGRKASRQGSSKVVTVVMVKGRLASGFCSPTLTWAQAPTDAKVKSNPAFANFIVISPYENPRSQLERIMRFALLNSYSFQLREVVHRPLPAFSSHTGIFPATKGAVRFVMDGRPIDVHRARLQLQRTAHRELQVARDHGRREA